jgi:hypothetical protein
MNKRVLFIFVAVFGLMVAGAGIFAFASETDEAPADAADEPVAVLAQDEADGDEPADEDEGTWHRFKRPHDELLDEVLDEMVAAGTLESELADEIRAAYEAKVDEKTAELPEDFKQYRHRFGPHFLEDWDFDLEELPPWLEELGLDEDLLGLLEDGLTREELQELREALPEDFLLPRRGLPAFPFGPLGELDIDLEGLLEDGRLDAEEREQIEQMLEEKYEEGFEFGFRGRGGRFGPQGPPSDDAEASFGIRIGRFGA